MKILEVSLGLGINSGGPVRSITGLTRALSYVDGCDVSYFVHDPTHVDEFNLGRTHIYRGTWENVGNDNSGEFERVLDAVKPDIVHFHGIWHLTLHQDQCLCRKRGIPYLIAPRGSLDAWSLKQKWIKKKVALMVYQMRDLRRSLALHVTAGMEAQHCRAMGYDGPFLLSPNGINFPECIPEKSHVDGGIRRMLFLSRMHPKKGVLELVEAWAKLVAFDSTIASGWKCELVYSLFDEAERVYEQEVKIRVRDLGLEGQIIFTGALDDVAKWAAYRRAECFVLPTHAENFGIVIGEALYAQLPVITTKNAPWADLERECCGWWIDLSEESLVRTLKAAMQLSDAERALMGLRGREYVAKTYSWTAIAQDFAMKCRRLLENAK